MVHPARSVTEKAAPPGNAQLSPDVFAYRMNNCPRVPPLVGLRQRLNPRVSSIRISRLLTSAVSGSSRVTLIDAKPVSVGSGVGRHVIDPPARRTRLVCADSRFV